MFGAMQKKSESVIIKYEAFSECCRKSAGLTVVPSRKTASTILARSSGDQHNKLLVLDSLPS